MTKPNRFITTSTFTQTTTMNHKLEITTQIMLRGSKALLAIESLGYKANAILESSAPNETKVELLAQINKDILLRVMEGTSSVYGVEKKS